MTIRRAEFGDEIAATDYVLREHDGSERTVRVRVGRPYEHDVRGWACPVEIAGFEPRYPDIRSADSLHALQLALSLAWYRLRDFAENYGTVLDPQGHVYTIDELRQMWQRHDKVSSREHG